MGMGKRMVQCAWCGEKLGEQEYWPGDNHSCGRAECEREIRYMVKEQESRRREEAEQDFYDRYR